MAGRQSGLIATYQLAHLGVSYATIHNWVGAGYLHPVLPRVHGVGHPACGRPAQLWAAVLYAGPGAALSHLTAAWWRGFVEFPGRSTHVSTPRTCLSAPGVIVHGRRVGLQRAAVRGMPVTTVAETLLGLAACTPDLTLVRKALARLEYAHGELDIDVLRAACRRGRPGSARLNHALDHHDPRLAHTNGPLEDGFHGFCERRARKGIPLPACNATVHGTMVDAYFADHGLVVELDGDDNHRTAAQRRRDRRRELPARPRSAGGALRPSPAAPRAGADRGRPAARASAEGG